MDNRILAKADNKLKAHHRQKIWRSAVTTLGVMVLIATVIALTLPASTMETKTVCGLEEHIHTEECYAEQPVSAAKTLVCGQEEVPAHAHAEECYEEQQVLVCSQEESEGHAHNEACYNEDGDLICELAETEGHTHTEACYQTERVLVCGLEETEGHTHTEECYETVEPTPICGEEHEHTAECYPTEKVLVCGLEEHTHTEECYKDKAESDPEADLEDSSVWAASVADVVLTGKWDEDVLAIAKTQLGYTESTKNFEKEGEKVHGITRYGQWYGIPYGDWCAMFASFCLNYAEVPETSIPYASGCDAWIGELTEKEMYAPAVPAEGEEKYEPKPGDLIFFDWDLDGSSDHVGFIYTIENAEENGESFVQIKTIEGNSNASVQQVKYRMGEACIMGYGELPENPKFGRQTKTASCEGYEVTVSYGPEAEIPMETELVVVDLGEEGLEEDREALFNLDISFVLNGEEIEPAEGSLVDVQVKVLSEGVASAERVDAVHKKDDGTKEDVKVTVAGEKVYAFTLGSFSTVTGYAGDASNLDGQKYAIINANTPGQAYALSATLKDDTTGATPVTVDLAAGTFSGENVTIWEFSKVGDGYLLKAYENDVDKGYLKSSSVNEGAYTLVDDKGGATVFQVNSGDKFPGQVIIEELLEEPAEEGVNKYRLPLNCYATMDYRGTFRPWRWNHDVDPNSWQCLLTPSQLQLTDDIINTGCIEPQWAEGAAPEGVLTYKWYKVENGVDIPLRRTAVTQIDGNVLYNLSEGGANDAWLNVSLSNGSGATFKVVLATVDGQPVENGPSAEFTVPYYNEIRNGSFEEPTVREVRDAYFAQPTIAEYGDRLKWSTTGSDQAIELIDSTHGYTKTAYAWHGEMEVPHGIQFAELNCEASGSLYQDVLTVPGSYLNWWLSHRARGKSSDVKEYDEMFLVMMPTEKAINITTQEQVKKVIENIGAYPGAEVYRFYDNDLQWTRHDSTGGFDADGKALTTYKVPDGAYLTRFFFVAGDTASGVDTIGNFLDVVGFGTDLPPVPEGSVELLVQKRVYGLNDADRATLKDQLTFNWTADNGQFGTVTLTGASGRLDDDGSFLYTGRLAAIADVETGVEITFTVTEDVPTATVTGFDLVKYVASTSDKKMAATANLDNGNTVEVKVAFDPDKAKNDVTAYFTNQYQPNLSQGSSFITVTKTFEGIEPELIPNDFTVILTPENGEPIRLFMANRTAVKDDGLTWEWKVYNVGLGKYTLKEDNAEIENYDWDHSKFGSVEVKAGKFTVTTDRFTTCSHTDWDVKVEGDTNIMFAATLTSSSGCVVISRYELRDSEKETVAKAVTSIQDPWNEPVTFFSIEKNGIGPYSIDNKSLRYDPEKQQIILADKSNWEQVSLVTYSISAASNPDISVTNTYKKSTGQVKLTKTGIGLGTDKFPFQFVLKNNENQPLTGKIQVILPGGTEPTDVELTDGTYTVNLGHDDEVTLILPDGTKYAVTETEHAGFISTFSKGVNKTTDRFPAGEDFDTIVAGAKVELTCSNNPGVVLPRTGGVGVWPFLLSGSALLLTALTLFTVAKRKATRRFRRAK